MSTVRMMITCNGKEVFNADHRKSHIDAEHKHLHERNDEKLEKLIFLALLTGQALPQLLSLVSFIAPVCEASRSVNSYIDSRDQLNNKLNDGVITNKLADIAIGRFSEQGLFTPVSSARLDKTESIYEPERLGL